MDKKQSYVYGVAIISMLFWGMSFVWTSILLNTYTPVTIITIRLLLSAAVLYLWLKIFSGIKKIDRKDYKLFFFSSLFNPFLYFMGENYGVMYTSPTISAVFIATIPLFVPIFGYIFFKERLKVLNIVGLIVSFAGVLIMLLNNRLQFEVDPLGVGALMLAVLTAVGYAIMLKKLATNYSPVQIIATQNTIGLFYFLPLFLIFDISSFVIITPTVEDITSFIALAVLCSSLAFIGFTIATRELGVSRTNIFANLIPVFTGIFSYIAIGEEITDQKLLGIVIVVGGLFLSQIKNTSRLRLPNKIKK